MVINSNIYGLVLAGGRSSRMKTDKSTLKFHGVDQSQYVYELISKYCAKTFISIRSDQSKQENLKNYPQLHDIEPYTNIGPFSGILSAMTKYSNKAWLVIAVDLPFVDDQTLQYLIHHRNTKKVATAYLSTNDGLPEPLCAIWESSSKASIEDYLKTKKTCPRKFLLSSNAEFLQQPKKNVLDNINTPDELKQAVNRISRQI